MALYSSFFLQRNNLSEKSIDFNWDYFYKYDMINKWNKNKLYL
jgi:hypothetical protein